MCLFVCFLGLFATEKQPRRRKKKNARISIWTCAVVFVQFCSLTVTNLLEKPMQINVYVMICVQFWQLKKKSTDKYSFSVRGNYITKVRNVLKKVLILIHNLIFCQRLLLRKHCKRAYDGPVYTLV